MSLGRNNKKLASASLSVLVGAVLGVPDVTLAGEKEPSIVSAKADKSNAAKTDAPQKGSVKTKTDPKTAAGPAAAAVVVEKKSYYVPTRGYRLEPQPDI
ncbi:MAG: hypothetical protein FJX15_15595, partial [Alphaproteobacteria bacterium]|nr:hypothetical protein [Alphaproteobacteria bacterium]